MSTKLWELSFHVHVSCSFTKKMHLFQVSVLVVRRRLQPENATASQAKPPAPGDQLTDAARRTLQTQDQLQVRLE